LRRVLPVSPVPGSRRVPGEDGTPRRRKWLPRKRRSRRRTRVAPKKVRRYRSRRPQPRASTEARRADRSQGRRPKPIGRPKSLASKSLRRTERSQSCRPKPAALNELKDRILREKVLRRCQERTSGARGHPRSRGALVPAACHEPCTSLAGGSLRRVRSGRPRLGTRPPAMKPYPDRRVAHQA